MGRIPDEEIQRLKREVSLERLCSRYGIKLEVKGKNLVGFCPWHPDEKPSFIVTPSKNLWHCMGECDEGGDVFSLVMKSEKVSFRRAAEILQELSGSIPPAPVITTPAGTTHPILVSPEDGLRDPELLTHVVDFYHRTFLNDPKAMKYLEKRHCFHSEAVKRFRIGYANRTLGYRIPITTADGKRLKARLQGLGIMRKTGHEHLSGSVVFPIMDLDGQPVQLYGRKITEGLRKGTPEHLYLEGPLCGIWNLEGIVHQKTWILCEAIIDALTLWCYRLRNVTTCFGKNTFTDDLWQLLRQVCPQKLIIAFDNDASGSSAAEKLAPQIAQEGVSVHRMKVPQGKDINGYVSILSGKEPQKIPDILQGLFADSLLLHRADSGTFCIPDVSVSSLAAKSKAAKEKKPEVGSSDSGTGADENHFALAAEEKHGGVQVRRRGDDLELVMGSRQYRVRGLARNTTYDVLKVNVRVLSGSSFHVDTLDLYNARHRSAFINTAAEELRLESDIIKKDMGHVLLKLEELQDERIKQALEPKKREVKMTDQERQEALLFLKDPHLLERIVKDFEVYGLVGEETNRLVGYLSVISRKLEKPLAVVIQSSSASGKSTLLEALLSMVPEEDRIQYSAMTGQSLFYLGDKDLRHKVLAIVEEEGIKQASYALKLLQSEGKLRIASTGKDATTGQMVTREYQVEGPVMVLTTSTAIDIDEELLNRCLVLSVDESREQTRAIHRAQREARTLEGLKRKLDKKDILTIHRNAQRFLRPLEVINNYSGSLTFLDDQTRMRRDHEKYLTLISAIAFLNQYQRPVKKLDHQGATVSYVEVTPEDIAIANTLAGEVLGRSLDELSPQTRLFLDLVDEMVTKICKEDQVDRCDYRFTQRDLREYTGWSDYQVKSHLRKLVSLEYVLIHRGGRGQRFVYELLYNGEGKDGKRFLMGLLNAEELNKNLFALAAKEKKYDDNREHLKNDRGDEKTDRKAPGSIQGAPREHAGSMPKKASFTNDNNTLASVTQKTPQNAYRGDKKLPGQSYRTDTFFF